jgi:hypothetical protein
VRDAMISREQVDELETLMGQLASVHAELTALSKKSPNDAVNKFKLGFIDDVIQRCNKLLGDSCRPFEQFTSFGIEEIVSNSDTTFMVSLYIGAIEKYRSDHIKRTYDTMWGETWCYDLPGGESVSAAPPQKLKEK